MPGFLASMEVIMPKLSVIIAVSQRDQLSKTLAELSSHLPEGTELLCVFPADAETEGISGEHVRILSAGGDLWSAGLAEARGDYVQFLRSGDIVPEFALAAALSKAERYGADCLRGSFLPLKGERTVLDLPEFTLSAVNPGSFHLPLSVRAESPLLSLAPAPQAWLFRRAFLTEGQLSPDEGEKRFYWRSLCRSASTVLVRDMLAAAAPEPPKALAERMQAVQAVESALIADGVGRETVSVILRHELEVLFAHFAPEKPGELRSFIRDYHGVCNDDIETLWRTACRSVSEEEPQAPREFPLRREVCKKVKVSVVLPIYNVEEYLNQALYSLSVQTLQEMEFLCVNDGSTDGSMTIMKEYAALDGRFRILDGPNGGYGKAMNRGLDAATGEYLGILEPDDYVSPGMYRRLYRVASQENLDFVKSNYFRFHVTSDGIARQKRMRVSLDERWYDRVVDPSEELGAFHLAMKTWNGIYRRSFLNNHHIRHHETPGASYQDNGFWFQTMCRARRVKFLQTAFYHYRQDNPNSSINNTAKLYCMTEEYQFILNWLNREGLAERFGGVYQAKKFHNFSTTYRRIAEEYRREYLHHICDQFRPADEAGLLREECFDPLFWKQLHEIMADPDAFYEKIRVSVILPVYNCERYLRPCLDSILEHNDQRIEVICVDDGSTDGSPAILADYGAKDSRVRVLTQKNAGAGAARNLGMSEARGEYLSFLDADDFFDPEMLRKAYNKAYLEESDIVVFRSQEYYEDTGRFIGMRSNIREEYLPEQQPFAGVDVPENIFRLFVGWAWDKLFRADFVRANGLKFQEQRTTNDLLFTYSAVVKAERISTMNNILAYHRKASGSLSVTREQSWDCFYKALLALRQQLRDWNLYDRFERDFVNYSLHFSLWQLTTVRGDAYYKLYDKLAQEWLDELGVTGQDKRYFYAPEQYDTLQHLLTVSAGDFLFDRLDETALTLEDVKRERNHLQRQNAAQQRTQAEQKDQLASLRRQLKEAKESSIRKAVRAVTRLPRKVCRLTGGLFR